MKIASIKKYSKEVLLKKFYKVTLLRNDPTKRPVYIFKKAIVTLEEFPIKNIHPTQFYFLRESLDVKKELQKEFAKKDIDIFHLKGFVEFSVSNKTFSLLPPIIEYQKQSNGKELAIIADGFHRIQLARLQKKNTIHVIVIKNIPEQYAYPAYPNPHDWNDVTIEGLPDDPMRKRQWRYPAETAYQHYHDFGSVFKNSTRPLSTTKIKQSHPRRCDVEGHEELE